MPWEFDKNHSRIGFAARHLGISTIHGEFEQAEVSLDLDAEDPTQWSMKANIQAASINTGIERRDDALRSEQYLFVEEFPTVTFETRRTERRGDGFVLVGPLTLHGVTRDVELAVSFGGEAVDRDITKRGFSAQGKIDRFQFGVGEPERTWTVGGEIQLVLDMEAIRH